MTTLVEPVNYLLRFAHQSQGLDVVRCVPRIHQTNSTNTNLANQTEHVQRLLAVFRTLAILSLGDAGGTAFRFGQHVLGQRSSGRVAGLAAGLTVQHLTLFTHHGRLVGRLVLAHLTLEGEITQLAVAVDDVLHHPVLGQVVGAVFVEVHHLAANGTGEAQCRGEELPVGGAHVAVGPGGAHHPAVRFAEDRQFVALLVVAGAAGGDAFRILRLGIRAGIVRSRLLQIYGAQETERVIAWQQHGVAEELFAGRTTQLVLHSATGYGTRLNVRWVLVRAV